MNTPHASSLYTAKCPYCGSRMSNVATACPFCGADVSARARAASGEPSHAANTDRRFDNGAAYHGQEPQFHGQSSPFASGAGNGYGGAGEMPGYAARRHSNYGAMAAVVVFVALFAGTILLVRHVNMSTSEEAALHSVNGQIAPGATGATNATNAAGTGSGATIDLSHAGKSGDNWGPVAQASTPPNTPPNAPPNAPPDTRVSAAPAPAQPVVTSQGGNGAPAAAQTQASTPPPVTGQHPSYANPAPQTRPVAPVASPPPAMAAAPEPTPTPRPQSHVTQQASIQPHPGSYYARPQPGTPPLMPAPTVGDNAPPTPYARSGNGSAGSSLAAARTDLGENNLAGAHAALSQALEQDPGNREANALRQQLASREQARDAALNSARRCLEQQEWKCAWHSAGDAMSIDSSSSEASSIEQRARADWAQSRQSGQQESDSGS